jgi:antitoxin ParD1/3/4
MRTTAPITITLPHDMAAMVKEKVASGEYATESEVIRDGLRILKARDEMVESWLREEVAKSYDDFAAKSETAIPAEEIMARLQQRTRARLAKRGK